MLQLYALPEKKTPHYKHAVPLRLIYETWGILKFAHLGAFNLRLRAVLSSTTLTS